MKPDPRNFSFALLTFLGLSSSGCGMEYDKGGFIDRAVAEDIREQASTETCTGGKKWLNHKPNVDNCADQDPRDDCQPGCYAPVK